MTAKAEDLPSGRLAARVAADGPGASASLLAAAFTAAEVVVPPFGTYRRAAFVLLAFAASIGATVARIVAQPEMHR